MYQIMKRINSFMSLLAGVLLLSLAACDNGNEGAIYQLSSEEKGFSFLTEGSAASYKPDYEDSVYVVRIARNFVDGDSVLPISVDCDPLFDIPTQVTFKDGQAYADLAFNIEGMDTGKSYTITLAIDSACLSSIQASDSAELAIKGIAETEIILSVDYSWKKVGTVVAEDDWGSEKAEVDLEIAQEFDNPTVSLYRLVDLEAALDPDYTDEGYSFQFYMNKTTYEIAAIPQFQLMGQYDSDYGNFYWVYIPGSYGCKAVKDQNKYTINALVGYDENGSNLSLYNYYTLEFTWTDGYPLDDISADDDEEEEEETGNGFGAIVAGGTADDYAGSFMAVFKDDGKDKDSVEVSIVKIDDETVQLNGLFSAENGLDSLTDVIGIKMKLFGGLLYCDGQDFIGKNKYADTVSVYTYDSETGYPIEGSMLVGGFKADGSIQFANYSYNEEAVNGLIVLYTDDEDTWLGAEIIPCDITLKAQAPVPATVRRHKVDVEASMLEARSLMQTKQATNLKFSKK